MSDLFLKGDEVRVIDDTWDIWQGKVGIITKVIEPDAERDGRLGGSRWRYLYQVEIPNMPVAEFPYDSLEMVDSQAAAPPTAPPVRPFGVGQQIVAMCDCHKGIVFEVHTLESEGFRARAASVDTPDTDGIYFSWDPNGGGSAAQWELPPYCGPKFDYDDEVEIFRASSRHYGAVGRVRAFKQGQAKPLLVKFGEDDWGQYNPRWVRLYDPENPVRPQAEMEQARIAGQRRARWKDERFLDPGPTIELTDPDAGEQLVEAVQEMTTPAMPFEWPDEVAVDATPPGVSQRFIIDIELEDGYQPVSENHISGALLLYLAGKTQGLSVSEVT